MSLFHRWHHHGLAVWLLLVAALAPLSRAADEVVVDLGEITTNQNGNYFDEVYPQYTVYFGCVTQGGMNWTVSGYPLSKFVVPVPNPLNALNKATFNAVGGSPTALGVGFSGPFSTTGFTEKEATVGATATISRSGSVKDMHTVT
ncbi:MAG: hypothetical protein EOP83_14040, partial [Verrucomicrobiaceae bacterium]